MFRFLRKNRASVIDFYMAGGLPTWADWKAWDKHQRAEALFIRDKIVRFNMLLDKYTAEEDKGKKLAIAEELAEFDEGDLARETRKDINREALGL